MKKHLALLLTAVIAVSVLGAVSATTAPKADAKYQAKLSLLGPSAVNTKTNVLTFRVTGRLTFIHYVYSAKAAPQPVTSALPNKVVYLYYVDCQALKGGACTGTRYWTSVRSDSIGYFVSPIRTTTTWPVSGNPGAKALTRRALTYARFTGDTAFGPCWGNLLVTTFSYY